MTVIVSIPTVTQLLPCEPDPSQASQVKVKVAIRSTLL
jgi:hypothetical protein